MAKTSSKIISEEKNPLLVPVDPTWGWTKRLRTRLQNFFVGVASFVSARAISRIVSDPSYDRYLKDYTEQKLDEHFTKNYEKLRLDSAAQILQTFEDRIDAEVKRTVSVFPLELTVRNRIDATIDPHIQPITERALRETESRLREAVQEALRPIIEREFGRPELTRMLNSAISDIAKSLATVKNSREALPRKVDETPIDPKLQHHAFERIFTAAKRDKEGNRCKVLMVGPAGSGKTIIAANIAKRFRLPFYFNGPLHSEYKLIGYRDANGGYQATPFRQAYELGGVYLFDEFDACQPQVLVTFNTALANGECDFPDGLVRQHPDFVCLAAANTPGTGANSIYTARERLDAATLDRFVVIEVPYDEQLEHRLANHADWCAHVQRVRKAMADVEPTHVVSMRASIEGGRLLAKGVDWNTVENWVLWRGRLSDNHIRELRKRIS